MKIGRKKNQSTKPIQKKKKPIQKKKRKPICETNLEKEKKTNLRNQSGKSKKKQQSAKPTARAKKLKVLPLFGENSENFESLTPVLRKFWEKTNYFEKKKKPIYETNLKKNKTNSHWILHTTPPLTQF